MNQTTTGIVVALAVAVVAVFFLFPGLSPFTSSSASQSAMLGSDTGSTTSSNQIASSTQQTMTTSDGLQITDEIVGTGPTLAPGDTITMSYVGMLTDGTVFDSTAAHGGTPLTLIVGADGSLQMPGGGGLIAGWSEGVVGMKQGGTRKLVIPPALGYGSQAVGNVIPANSTLVFEVQLTGVQAPQ